MTLYSLIKTIKGIANIQPNISFVHSGDVFELNKRADIDYPAFVISQNVHHNNTIDDEELYGLTLFAIDRLTSDADNQLDIQSWANELLKGIIVQIEELGLGTIIGDVVVQPFTERFESLCAGCYAQIQVRINNIDCESDLWLMKLLEKIKNVIKFKDIEELEGVDPDTLLWYVGDKPIHIIDVQWTLDEDGALMGTDGKYYERWVDTIHGLEKRGDELEYDYIRSEEYVISEDKNYVQYKEYKTYYSPNRLHTFKTDAYRLTEKEEIEYSVVEDEYIIDKDGKYYEKLRNEKFNLEKQGNELRFDYVKSDEYVISEDKETVQYKEYKTYYTPSGDALKTDEYRMSEPEPIVYTLDEDGALLGEDGKYYQRLYNETFDLEKSGDELHYDYVKSDEYIISREGHVQYKEYKTYYSPNGEHSYKTNEFIYGPEEEIQYTLDKNSYLIGVDGKYYERWYNDEYDVERQGAELQYEYIKSDEFIVPRPGYIQYKEYKEYTLPNNITKLKTDEYIYGPEEEIPLTLDENVGILGDDGKYYQRLYNDEFHFEKKGAELDYEYVLSEDYIIPREGYVQYKKYKVYHSPNGKTEYPTADYILTDEEEIPLTLDEDGAYIGEDYKLYERWYNDEFEYEKQGAELRYEYIESTDFIVPRPGYIQYKWYKTYYSPNNKNSFPTTDYILGEEQKTEGEWVLDVNGYIVGEDGKYYEKWIDAIHGDERKGSELTYDYIKSDEYEYVGNGYMHYKYYKTYYTPSGTELKTTDYVWGDAEKVPLTLDLGGYIVGEDGLYYERYYNTEFGYEEKGEILESDYVKSDEYEIDGDEVRYKYYLTYYTPNNTPIKTDEFVMGEAEEIQYTLDMDGSILGDDGKYYERWYNNTYNVEKQGNVLRNDYIKSDDYIVPREGYIQYKYYLTYYKPNGTAIKTDEYILGEEIKVDDTDNYTLRFTSLDDESNSLSFNSIPSGVSFEVSKDMVNWETVTKSTVYFYFQKGETIYVRGNNPNGISNILNKANIRVTRRAVVSGDVMSLIYPTEEQNTKIIPCPYCFASLFENRLYLEFDDNFKLSATTLTDYCYERMFAYCYAMTKAPELPATTLANYCYKEMFRYCFGLIKAPTILPATTLASYCYNYMFHQCTSLTTAPELPAITLATGCYNHMFGLCDKLNEVKCNARYNEDGTEITIYIGYNWMTVSDTGTFYKNPNWAGPTTRSADTIPTEWTILDWE